MSKRNREHFDIESRDHLQCLLQHPQEAYSIQRSLIHRIHLHKNRNMYLVPPMLFQKVGETDTQHYQRELKAGGFVIIDFQTVRDEPGPKENEINYHPMTPEIKQQELF